MAKVEFGKLDVLITDDLINECLNKHYIIIYGHAKSGKILIARLLSEKLKRKLIVTDDFIHYGFKECIYVIREKIKEINEPLIIEGVQTARLLRKGIEMNDFFADLIIHLECDEQSIEQSYINDGEINKIPQIHKFNQTIDKIFEEYKYLQEINYPEKKPQIITLNTSYNG